MEKEPHRFNAEEEQNLNDVLSGAPEMGETAEMDLRRIEWIGKVADLFSNMKLSREKLKEDLDATQKLDDNRIKFLLDDPQKYAKQAPKETRKSI